MLDIKNYRCNAVKNGLILLPIIGVLLDYRTDHYDFRLDFSILTACNAYFSVAFKTAHKQRLRQSNTC